MARRNQTVWVANGFPAPDEKALNFAAPGSDRLLSSGSTLSVADAWTVMVWVKKTQSFGSPTQGIFWHWDPTAATARNRLNIGQPDRGEDNIYVEITDDDNVGRKLLSTSGDELPINTWVMVGATWNGANPNTDQCKVYANGVRLAVTGTDSDSTSGMADIAREAMAGAPTTAFVNPLAGTYRLYNATYWSAELSAAELLALHNGGNPAAIDPNSDFGDYASSAALQAWYRFGRDGGNLGLNYATSGNGLDLSNLTGITAGDIVDDFPEV